MFRNIGDQMQNQDNRNNSKNSAEFGERLRIAAAAKKAQMERWRLNQVDPTDPVFLARQMLRQTAVAAKEAREAQRKAEKVISEEHRKAALKVIEIQSAADQAARETAEAESAVALAALADQRKAARDARYAARKAKRT